MNNNFNIQNFNANNAAINLGGTIESDQVRTQNYYATDPEAQRAIDPVIYDLRGAAMPTAHAYVTANLAHEVHGNQIAQLYDRRQ